jgi:hypothetical protein
VQNLPRDRSARSWNQRLTSSEPADGLSVGNGDAIAVISSNFASSVAKPHCAGSKRPHASCIGFAFGVRFSRVLGV